MATRKKQTSEAAVQEIRRKTRRRFAPEEKIRIVAYDRIWGVRSLPNKFFEYMAAGLLPVIVPSYSEEIRKIVEAERCGLLVDCEKAEEIADAIVYLREHPEEAREMGRRGREAFLARHNWSGEGALMLEMIRGWCLR